MGPPPHSVQQLLCTLEQEPDLVTWSAERNTTVWKGANGKLGFRAKTYKGKLETFTVILKVKEECCITAGQLKQFDRITSINNYNITNDSEQHILNILTTLNDTGIALTLCRPVKFKIPKSNTKVESRSRSGHDHDVGECSCEVSDRSISFDSWNSTGTESLELPEISTDVSDEQRSDLKESETSFDVGVKSKRLPITKLCARGTEKGVTKILQEANSNVDKDVDIVPGNRSNNSDVNPNVKFIPTSSDSNQTVTSSDSHDYPLKRGISQVSSSGSNNTRSSNPTESTMRRIEKPTKSKDHKITKFVKTGSIENNDEEVEPLHPEESTSPRTVARLAPYKHFNMDDRSYSMPTTVSVADIEVEDPTLSLPHGASNVGMNQIHSTNMCLCTVCLPGSDHRLCSKCAVKTKPGSSSPSTASSSMSVPFSEEDSRKILEKPQHAVWDGINTHVVEIDKDKSKGFGFSCKVMVGENQDSSVETYTLVNEVDKEGPSKDKLRIGDWVRSVNGTPIQVPQDAYSLLNSTKDATRRLVIQRPIGLSKSHQKVERDKAVQDLNPPSPQSPDGAGDQDPLIPGTIAPKKRQDKSMIPPNIYIIDSSHGESCSKAVLPPFPRSAKLPKVRIFVCGSEAEKCLHFLLKDSILDIELQNHCYSFISCSMATDCFGNILLSQPCSNLFSASPHTSSHSQSDHRGGGDTKCKQCGGDFVSSVDGHDHGQGHLVNVELFAVPDDRFFHFCCSYLFTKSSIFILTFDGSRMLRSATGEFVRLQNLSHTIRSMAGEDSHIMSCGFIDDRADTGNITDEVRALFYTPLNSVLQNFEVFGPELVSGNSSSSASDNLDENQLLQTLWKVVTETVQRQQVLQPSLLLIDHMISLREKEFILTESQLMEVIKGKLPNYQMDVHQMILTYLMENREILLGKASSFINPKSHYHMESLILVNPQCLLRCLQKIITTVNEDKQNWIKTHATGFIKTSSFLEFCGETDKKQQIIADFMECNGIIVKKPNSSNSGVATEYFFPYFSVTPSTADSERDVVESGKFELYLKFVDNESSQVYFALLFTIAGNVDTPSSFNVQDVQTCVFQHKGYHAFAYHQKIQDRVHFVFKREDKSASACPVDLFSWLKDICHDVLDSLYVSFLLGAPCPRGENCARTTADSIHVIDLREKKPQFCDKERVDTMKPIRKWKQKDSQVQETVVSVGSRRSKLCKQPVTVLDLPHTVVHNVCVRLRIPSELGRDWRGLAGLMGYTNEEVRMIETVKDPVRQLLYDWSTTHGGKIDQLIQLLEELNMENVLCYLRQALPQNNLNLLSSPPTATQNSTVSFQTLSLSQNSDSSENSYLTGQVHYQRSKVTEMSKVTETEVMPLYEEGQGQMIRMNNLDGNNQMDMIGSSNQAITPVETVMGFNGILKS